MEKSMDKKNGEQRVKYGNKNSTPGARRKSLKKRLQNAKCSDNFLATQGRRNGKIESASLDINVTELLMDICDGYKEYDREEIKNKILSLSLNNDFWENLIRKRFPNLKHEKFILANAKKVYLRIRKVVVQKQAQFEEIVRNVKNAEDSDANEILTAQKHSENDSTFMEVIASPHSGGCENAVNDSLENIQIFTAGPSTKEQYVKNIESNQGPSDNLFLLPQVIDNHSIVQGTHEIPRPSEISAIRNLEIIESMASGTSQQLDSGATVMIDVSQENSFARGNLVWASCGGWFPGLIIDGRDALKEEILNKVWIYWIGDGRVSNITINPRNIKHFFERIDHFIDILENKKSLKINRATGIIYSETLQLLRTHFAISDDTKCAGVWMRKKFVQSNIVTLLPFPSNIINDLTKFSEKCTNGYYQQRPTEKTIELYRGSCEKISMIVAENRNICIRCLRRDKKILVDHPIFNYKLCSSCLNILAPRLYALTSEGKCGCCTLCGLILAPESITKIFCSRHNCTRAYCLNCVKILSNHENWVGEITTWICFLCQSEEWVDIIRENWQKKFFALFLGEEYASRISSRNLNLKPKLRMFSAFDGIATAKLIVDMLDVEVEIYYSSEIDEDAMDVANNWHGKSIRQHGDITEIVKNDKLIESMCPIHLLVGGSPCEELSRANNNGLGLDAAGTGSLFFEFVKLKRKIEKFNNGVPLLFLFENVIPKRNEWKSAMEKELDCNFHKSDAADVSPCHRPRIFGTNLPWNSHHRRNVILQDVLSKNRIATVEKMATITAHSNSLLQTTERIHPIKENGKGDIPTTEELYAIMGFPPHYATIRRFSFTKILSLIGKAWNVPQNYSEDEVSNSTKDGLHPDRALGHSTAMDWTDEHQLRFSFNDNPENKENDVNSENYEFQDDSRPNNETMDAAESIDDDLTVGPVTKKYVPRKRTLADNNEEKIESTYNPSIVSKEFLSRLSRSPHSERKSNNDSEGSESFSEGNGNRSDISDDEKENDSVNNTDNEENEDPDVDDIEKGPTRMIIDMEYFLDMYRQKYLEHKGVLDCEISSFNLVRKTARGLKTVMTFRCDMCNAEVKISSEDRDRHPVDADEAVVVGSMVSGAGYSELEKVFSAASIHFMNEKTFLDRERKVLQTFEIAAEESMKKAGEKVFLHCQEHGLVNKHGYGETRVQLDGCWGKRSYKTKYNALYGIVYIISDVTGEILFVGIFNKYCLICKKAENKNQEPRKHDCFRNFDPNKPSTQMETYGLVDGFKRSIEDHKLVYAQYVGDGDTNLAKDLSDQNPYAHLEIVPKKFECVNHLKRNLCTKLYTMCDYVNEKFRRNRDCKSTRELVKSNILKLRKHLEAVVEKWQQNNSLDPLIKRQCLAQEVQNIPNHFFGDHSQCKVQYIDLENIEQVTISLECYGTESTDEERRNLDRLKQFELLEKIKHLFTETSCNAESLIANFTTNAVESANNEICMILDGKRINLGGRSQVKTKGNIAVVHHNSRQVVSEYYKAKNNPAPITASRMEEKRRKQNKAVKKHRAEHGRLRNHDAHEQDNFYGAESENPEMTAENFEIQKAAVIRDLQEKQKNRVAVERDTVGQSQCDAWKLARKSMITASKAGMISRMRAQTSCQNAVQQILYPSLCATPAMNWGVQYENDAKLRLHQKLCRDFCNSDQDEIRLRSCGLFIDAHLEWLGASPDAMIDDQRHLIDEDDVKGCVELKGIYSARQSLIREAAQNNKNLQDIFVKIKISDKKPCAKSQFSSNQNKVQITDKLFLDLGELNRTHHYFYQIQLQMRVTETKYCIFAVYTEKDIHYIKVHIDEEFIKGSIIPQLTAFWNDCLLPEIVRKDFLKPNKKIRDPQRITQAKASVREKKSLKKRKAFKNASEVDSDDDEKDNSQNDFGDNQHSDRNKDTVISEKKASPKACNKRRKNTENSESTTSKADDEAFERDGCIITGRFEMSIDQSRSYNANMGVWYATRELEFDIDELLDDKVWLHCEAIDFVIRLFEEHYPHLHVHSVGMVINVTVADPIPYNVTKCAQILGGPQTSHWRTILYLDEGNDGPVLYVYDSLNCTNEFQRRRKQLSQNEQNYVSKRFPKLDKKNINFCIMADCQKDYNGCGVYALAYLLELANDKDPSKTKFPPSAALRRHLVQNIIRPRALVRFPTLNNK